MPLLNSIPTIDTDTDDDDIDDGIDDDIDDVVVTSFPRVSRLYLLINGRFRQRGEGRGYDTGIAENAQ
jgi:hypothetical protein